MVVWDVRIAELKLKQGEIKRAEWKAYIKGLPDVAQKGVWFCPVGTNDACDVDSMHSSEVESEEA